uniref:F-ATPase gamma subunit n=1 Tax=Karenia brevis TaxID=156230 RepID=Q00GM7_KARBR|nr:plastid ATP synthase gamma subunit protein precursor [Karenia brevis]
MHKLGTVLACLAYFCIGLRVPQEPSELASLLSGLNVECAFMHCSSGLGAHPATLARSCSKSRQRRACPGCLHPLMSAVSAPVSASTASASISELDDRAASVREMQSMTSALKLVSAASRGSVNKEVLSSRPFVEEVDRLLETLLKHIKQKEMQIPLLQKREVKKVSLVVITSDHGLCGAYNFAVIEKAEKRKADLESQGLHVEFFAVGEQGSAYFQQKGLPVRQTMPCGKAPSNAQAKPLFNNLRSMYFDGEIDRVEILYTPSVSTLPAIRTLIPLIPDGTEAADDEIFQRTPMDDLEERSLSDNVAQMLDVLSSLHLNGHLLLALQESVASEHALRAQVLECVTERAGYLQQHLEQEVGRARQAKITDEVFELFAGMESIAVSE